MQTHNDLAALFRVDGQAAPLLDPSRLRSLSVEEGRTNKIVLPRGLSEQQAVDWLQKSIASKETEVRLRYIVPGYPVDAAIAFQTALEEVFGFTQLLKTPGTFFNPGQQPPVLVKLPVGPDKEDTIVLGRFSLPNVTGFLQTGIDLSPKQLPVFQVNVVSQKKFEGPLNLLFERVKEIQKARSIYKGQVVRINFEFLRREEGFNPDHDSPTFVSLPQIGPEALVIEPSSRRALEASLWERLRDPEFFRQNGMGVRHGVLLMGQYGTGKTLAMTITARMASDSGWTVLYLQDVRDLIHALRFAELYAPALVVAEDFDKASGDGDDERSPEMNALLNVLDGMDTKTTPIITVVTTNHPENVHPAYRRPGRLDTFINFPQPGPLEARELLLRYLGSALSPEASLEAASEKVAEMGMSPAFIKETAEKAITFTRIRLKAAQMDGLVTDQDVELAIGAMMPHLGLSVNREKVTLVAPAEIAELMKDIARSVEHHLGHAIGLAED